MTRVEELASQFDSVTAEALQALEASDEAIWQTKSSAEGWTVAALAHHFVSGLQPISGLLQGITAGADLPPITEEMLEQQNLANAKTHAAAAKQDVVALLKQNAADALSALRQLTDEDLQRSAQLFGNTVTADDVAQGILIGHVQNHLESFKATIG